MNIWFTADHHFNHPGIIRVCRRPFEITLDGLAAMNEALIAAWNARVQKHDTVYHLGDFLWRGDPQKFLARLNGNVVFMRGNHDARNFHNKVPGVHDVKLVNVPTATNPEQQVWLSHYAHRTWPKSHYGTWHLYGHSHSSLWDDPNALSMDVGVDTRPDFAPYSVDEIAAHMARKRFKPVDHHGRQETAEDKAEVLASLEPTRKEVLLRAAYDLLKKADEAHFVEQATAITVHYDDAECDGHCLMEDIAAELGIENEK